MKSNLTVPVNNKTKFVCRFVWNEKKIFKMIILSK